MAPSFKSKSVPCIINYNDDDQLLSIVIHPGSVPGSSNGYTFFTDNSGGGGVQYPYTSTLIYNTEDDFNSKDDTQYELRTGSDFAVVNVGSPDQPKSQVAVSQHKGIRDKIFESNYGKWTVVVASAGRSMRASRASEESAGASGEY